MKSEQFKDQAQKDGFTQLYNKYYTEVLIRKIIDQHTEQKHAMILIDIDNLKLINDQCGHDVGDQVIKSFSRNLKDSIRKKDIAGRFGGDEFVVFMQDVLDEKSVTLRIEELLKMDNYYNCTNSVGVSFYPDDGKDFEALFKNADLALYQSKKVKNGYTLFKNMSGTKQRDGSVFF